MFNQMPRLPFFDHLVRLHPGNRAIAEEGRLTGSQTLQDEEEDRETGHVGQ